MMLEAERCQTRAASCEKIADQDSAPMEMRVRFARKANFFRIVARIDALDETKRIQDEAGLRILEDARFRQGSSGFSPLIQITLAWCRLRG